MMAKKWLLSHSVKSVGDPRPDQLATDAMLRSFVDQKCIADPQVRLPALFRMWINEHGRQPTPRESAALGRYFERRSGISYEGDGDRRDLILALGCVVVLHLVPSLLYALRGIAPGAPPDLFVGVLFGGVFLFNLSPVWVTVPLAAWALVARRIGFVGGLILGVGLTLVVWVVAAGVLLSPVTSGSSYENANSSHPIDGSLRPIGPIGPLQSPSGVRGPSGTSSGASSGARGSSGASSGARR